MLGSPAVRHSRSGLVPAGRIGQGEARCPERSVTLAGFVGLKFGAAPDLRQFGLAGDSGEFGPGEDRPDFFRDQESRKRLLVFYSVKNR
jgi:hypothetical protein